jgi:hypothetical protein
MFPPFVVFETREARVRFDERNPGPPGYRPRRWSKQKDPWSTRLRGRFFVVMMVMVMPAPPTAVVAAMVVSPPPMSVTMTVVMFADGPAGGVGLVLFGRLVGIGVGKRRGGDQRDQPRQ